MTRVLGPGARLNLLIVRWGWLVAVFALALANYSATAQSTIAYVRLSTPNPDPNFPWDYQGMRLLAAFPQNYKLDFDGDGNAEYTIGASGFSLPHSFHIAGENLNSVWVLPTFDSSLAAALSSGVEIGPGLSSPPYAWEQGPGEPAVFSSVLGTGSLGFYLSLHSAYCALRFQLDGQTHYGWVRVGAPLPAFNGGWIYDYAYETRPNTPICAGAKPVLIPLAMPQVVRAAHLRLHWPSVIGRAYQVQSKDRLDAPTWTNLGFVVIAAATNAVVDLPMNGSTRFFRIVEAD